MKVNVSSNTIYITHCHKFDWQINFNKDLCTIESEYNLCVNRNDLKKLINDDLLSFNYLGCGICFQPIFKKEQIIILLDVYSLSGIEGAKSYLEAL